MRVADAQAPVSESPVRGQDALRWFIFPV